MAFKITSRLLIVVVAVSLFQTALPYAGHPILVSNESFLKTQNSLRQNNFLEWIISIIRPPPITTTTPRPTQPQRECPDCSCGMINVIRRIVGGQETEVNQYPWMALLLSNNRFYCGATLINDMYVATAAHCLRGFNETRITVRLLEHNRDDSSANVIDRQAAALIMHESYNSRTYDNDIGLIRFREPVNMTGLLRPVCMPERNNSFADETSIVTGWGALSEGGPISDTLQEVQVPILSQEDCRNSNYGAAAITDNMLCAGFEEGGKDSCQGDSGGPLHVVANDSMEYQLAGVVSWGHGCAKPRSPGVYARVNRYNDWIAERTRDACYCHSVITEN